MRSPAREVIGAVPDERAAFPHFFRRSIRMPALPSCGTLFTGDAPGGRPFLGVLISNSRASGSSRKSGPSGLWIAPGVSIIVTAATGIGLAAGGLWLVDERFVPRPARQEPNP
jgi:hypothetical protein